MDSLKIIGGNKLEGTIQISGAKNAALPLMACGLLLDSGELNLSSMPDLADTKSMSLLLYSLGIEVKNSNNIVPLKNLNNLKIACLLMGNDSGDIFYNRLNNYMPIQKYNYPSEIFQNETPINRLKRLTKKG